MTGRWELPSEKWKEFSDELSDFHSPFDTQNFRTELSQIRSELQGKVVDGVEDFEIDVKIIAFFLD